MSRKFLTAPQAMSIDDLVQLLRDPVAYTAHLEELRALEQAITDKLTLVKTQEEADVLFQRASAQMAETAARASLLEAQREESRLAALALADERVRLNEEATAIRLELRREQAHLESQRSSFVIACHERAAQESLDRDALEVEAEALRQAKEALREEQSAWRQKLEQLALVMRG